MSAYFIEITLHREYRDGRAEETHVVIPSVPFPLQCTITTAASHRELGNHFSFFWYDKLKETCFSVFIYSIHQVRYLGC